MPRVCDDHQFGLKPLWFTGGEWASGFATAVLMEQYDEAKRAYKPSKMPESKRVSRENRPYYPTTLPKKIWVEDEDLYQESQRQYAQSM
jgi:hypothetical protein